MVPFELFAPARTGDESISIDGPRFNAVDIGGEALKVAKNLYL